MALILHHNKIGKNNPVLLRDRSTNRWHTKLKLLNYPKGLDLMCGTCHLLLHRKEMTTNINEVTL